MFHSQKIDILVLSAFIFGVLAVFRQAISTFGQTNPKAHHDASHTDGSQVTEIDDDLIVDLGYARYKGFYNQAVGLNTWLGVRYAASPTGKNRWQRPKPPEEERESVIEATQFPPMCPQSLSPPSPPDFDFTGSEDCLFLSVFAPPGAKDLPVLFQIHGGGFIVGSGQNNLSSLIKTGNRSFIGVDIQYRLAAFGFLSSAEVQSKGAVNAGLLDQQFALQWTQSHIHLFGGNRERVTIGGESAGAGSVLHHVLAYGGTQGTSLFQNAWAASPCLPHIYKYDDSIPTKAYEHFAREVGCVDRGTNRPNFNCLVNTPTSLLQKANFIVSTSVGYNQLAFLPVIDGDLIHKLPSKALSDRQLNGVNLLASNMANEGPLFVRANITTAADLRSYVTKFFPSLTPADIEDLLALYTPVPPASEPTLYATTGLDPPTALSQSSYATGYQQASYLIYAEKTFVCPSYYLCEAFSPAPASASWLTSRSAKQTDQRKSYRYQYSVPGAIHGDDIGAYFGGPSPPFPSVPLPQTFISAAQTIIANFVTSSVPSVAGGPDAIIEDWPVYTSEHPLQVNLNITGNATAQAPGRGRKGGNVTIVRDDGSVRNKFTVVDAGKWEAGRGERCEFWRRVAERVPI